MATSRLPRLKWIRARFRKQRQRTGDAHADHELRHQMTGRGGNGDST